MVKENFVSEIFDPSLWQPVEGCSFRDITYHRARGVGAVRIAFDRPEVRNAFRPQTVDELYTALEHARTSSDVGAVIVTGNVTGIVHQKLPFMFERMSPVRPMASTKVMEAPDRPAPPFADENMVPDMWKLWSWQPCWQFCPGL